MTSFSVILDTRERRLCEEISKIATVQNLSITVQTTNLDVGDIQICQTGNEDSEKSSLVALIERKTIQDFYSSIRDGRYAEQKVRFRSLHAPIKFYMIEGDIYSSEGRGKFPSDYLLQRLMRLQYMYNIGVVQTPDIRRSAEYILLLVRKLNNNSLVCKDTAEKPYVDNDHLSYKESISIVKKENMTPSTVYFLQLKQIPGFANTLVTAIATAYPNLLTLLKSLQTEPEEVGKVKINGKRQLGMKAVETMKRFLGVE